jgi:prevent-host-death family protein
MTDERGIRELRADLAAMVRRAGAGERIVITVDGLPVAQLGPLAGAAEVTIADLVAAGALRAPRRRDRPPAPEPMLLPVDIRAVDTLDEVRG